MATVLCFSTVDWDYLWHRPQAVMSSLAQDGYRILYVDTIGLRSPRPRDARRILSRFVNLARTARRGLHQPQPGIQVFSPLVLPLLNCRWARRVNVALLVGQLRRHLDGPRTSAAPGASRVFAAHGASGVSVAPSSASGSAASGGSGVSAARGGSGLSAAPAVSGACDGDELIVWVYLPTATVLECVERLPHRVLVYEAIDALGSNPAGVSQDYERAERSLLERADLVLATSPTLYAEKAVHNANTHWVPPGVGPSFFADVTRVASEIEGMGRPRICFFGTVDHRLDLESVLALARRRREWSFVLIGPTRCDTHALDAEANVHLLGAIPHDQLLPYLQGMDVLFLPYVLDDFTRGVYPAKIYECLAVGIPIVATRLPALEEFGELVRLVDPGPRAGSHGSFEEALVAALAEDDPPLAARRQEKAAANSWEARYQEIRGLLEAVL